jgi:hypothetical protein
MFLCQISSIFSQSQIFSLFHRIAIENIKIRIIHCQSFLFPEGSNLNVFFAFIVIFSTKLSLTLKSSFSKKKKSNCSILFFFFQINPFKKGRDGKFLTFLQATKMKINEAIQSPLSVYIRVSSFTQKKKHSRLN